MAQVYLYSNSILYLVLAIRTTLAPQNTATRLGYLTLSDHGRSEYLVVYGGLQVGLAILFLLMAQNAAYFRLGLLISVGMYAPIILYRLVTSLLYWPVPNSTLGTIALEALFLLAGLWLYWKFE